MTTLGIGSYALAWAVGVPRPEYAPAHPMDVMAFAQRAVDLGVHLIQIADNIPLHTLSASQMDALEAFARGNGLAIEVGTRGIAPSHLQTYIGLAQRFGSPILRVVVDTATDHPEPDDIVHTLKGMLPAFERAGVTLAIENHDRFKAHTLAQIVRDIGSPRVGICLDTVNSFGALEGPHVVVEQLGPFVVNLHVKDFKIYRANHNMGFLLEGTPAGQGMLNVPWLLDTLHGMGRTFNAILELWPAPESTIEATIAKEAAWTQESVTYLRTLIKD